MAAAPPPGAAGPGLGAIGAGRAHGRCHLRRHGRPPLSPRSPRGRAEPRPDSTAEPPEAFSPLFVVTGREQPRLPRRKKTEFRGKIFHETKPNPENSPEGSTAPRGDEARGERPRGRGSVRAAALSHGGTGRDGSPSSTGRGGTGHSAPHPAAEGRRRRRALRAQSRHRSGPRGPVPFCPPGAVPGRAGRGAVPALDAQPLHSASSAAVETAPAVSACHSGSLGAMLSAEPSFHAPRKAT